MKRPSMMPGYRLAGRVTRRAVLLAVFAATACTLSSPSPTLNDAAGVAVEVSFCRDEVNRYRMSIGRSVLARSRALEDFAAQAAAVDGTAHIAHHHFTMTNGGGIAIAETEILWWRASSVRTVIEQGLAQMWQEGPQGHHYTILVGPYSEVGCGIFVNGGEVTVVQDFR